MSPAEFQNVISDQIDRLRRAGHDLHVSHVAQRYFGPRLGDPVQELHRLRRMSLEELHALHCDLTAVEGAVGTHPVPLVMRLLSPDSWRRVVVEGLALLPVDAEPCGTAWTRDGDLWRFRFTFEDVKIGAYPDGGGEDEIVLFALTSESAVSWRITKITLDANEPQSGNAFVYSGAAAIDIHVVDGEPEVAKTEEVGEKFDELCREMKRMLPNHVAPEWFPVPGQQFWRQAPLRRLGSVDASAATPAELVHPQDEAPSGPAPAVDYGAEGAPPAPTVSPDPVSRHEAERLVLSAFMHDANYPDTRDIVMAELKPENFLGYTHRELFSTMRRMVLAGEQLSPRNVAHYCPTLFDAVHDIASATPPGPRTLEYLVKLVSGAAPRCPFSREAELNVLAACLLRPEVLDTADLRPEDFYFEHYALLFEVMRDLRRGPGVDPVHMADALKRRGVWTSDFANHIGDMLDVDGRQVANFPTYQEVVQQKAMLRRMISAAADVERDMDREAVLLGQARKLEHGLRAAWDKAAPEGGTTAESRKLYDALMSAESVVRHLGRSS